MRFSTILKMSCLSTLVFSPAMAQEAEDVHAEALKVLREQLAKPLTNSFSTRPSIGESRRIEGEIRRDRDERNMLLREQAEAERARRKELHEQKRQEFDQELREREFIRQRQREYDESIARQMRALNPDMATEDVHSQALSVLRGTEPASAPAASPTPAPATTEAIAPAAERVSEPAAVAETPEELHRRALEILRANQEVQVERAVEANPQRTVTPAVIPPRTTEVSPAPAATAVVEPVAAPSDEYIRDLERRAVQMVPAAEAPDRAPVATTPPPSRPAPAPAPAAPAAQQAPQPSVAEIHDKALQALRQQSAAAAPVMEQRAPQATETIQRQNVDVTRSASQSSPAAAPRTREAQPVPANLEESARAVLRQQQQAQLSPAPAAATAPRAAAPATSQANEQYSRELEERARQILRERAQAQQSATAPVATPAPETAPASVPAELPAPQAATAPATTPSSAADVHLRALEALRQGTGSGEPAVLTKREKLRALTDLYRADKIGSAEYHQKRAQILAEPGE